MGILTKLRRIFSAKANTAVENMENPSEISSQIIRELDDKYNQAVNAQAKVKATSLANKASLETAKQDVIQWEKRLNGIIDKIDAGDATPETAELAKTAADKYNEAIANVTTRQQVVNASVEQIKTMEKNVKNIQSSIEKAKDKSKNIQARQKVAEASKTVNEAMASTNTDGLMGTLERMEEKVAETEYIAEAYADTASNGNVASKIDEMLNNTSAEDTLAAFRANRKK